jgi:predicted helicase
MTATPRYFTNRVVKEAENRDYKIASMNDESRFGPKFHIIEMIGVVSPPGPLQRSI